MQSFSQVFHCQFYTSSSHQS